MACPCIGGYYAKHTDAAGKVTVQDGRLAVTGLASNTAGFAQDRARSSVSKRLGKQPSTSELVVVPGVNGANAKLAWQVAHQDRQAAVSSRCSTRAAAPP